MLTRVDGLYMKVTFIAPVVATLLCGALMSGCAQTVESKPAVMPKAGMKPHDEQVDGFL